MPNVLGFLKRFCTPGIAPHPSSQTSDTQISNDDDPAQVNDLARVAVAATVLSAKVALLPKGFGSTERAVPSYNSQRYIPSC